MIHRPPFSKPKATPDKLGPVVLARHNASTPGTVIQADDPRIAGIGSTPGGFTSGSVIFADSSGVLDEDNANFNYNDGTDTLSTPNLNITGLTQGSIPFIGASGAVSQDNSNFFWDDTNNQLQLGAGTVLLPALTLGDDNSGLYRPGSGQVGVSIGGLKLANFRDDGLTVYIDGTTGDGDETNEGFSAVRALSTTDAACVNFFTGAESSSANCKWTFGLLPNNTQTTDNDLCISRNGTSTRVMRFQNGDGYVRVVQRLKIGADSAPAFVLDVTGNASISSSLAVGTTLNAGATTITTMTTSGRVGINKAVPSYGQVFLEVGGDTIIRGSTSTLADGLAIFRTAATDFCRVHWHTGSGDPGVGTIQWNLGLRGDISATNDLFLASISMTGSNLGAANIAARWAIGTTGHMFLGKFLGVNHPSGTTAPVRALEVTDATAAQLRLTHTATVDFADFTVDTNGLLTISPSGDIVFVDDALRVGTATDAVDNGDFVTGASSAARIFYDQSAALCAFYNSSNTIVNQISAVASTNTIFNEQGVDIDFRVEGDNKTSCLLLDASDDEVAIDGRFSLIDSTPTQITGDQNNYAGAEGTATSRSSVWRLSSDASRNITGIANGLQGRCLRLVNVGAQNIVIQNQNASSTDVNRVITGTGGDITLAADDTMDLWYDSTTQRWRVFA